MKLDSAKSTALGMSNRFGIDVVVFRLPGWSADEYGIKPIAEVPAGAEIAETFIYSRASVPAKAEAPAVPAQGGLFE